MVIQVDYNRNLDCFEVSHPKLTDKDVSLIRGEGKKIEEAIGDFVLKNASRLDDIFHLTGIFEATTAQKKAWDARFDEHWNKDSGG